jgi:hypothetical protein
MEKHPAMVRTLSGRTTTSNLIAVRRLLLAPDDPEVCGPALEQRYRLRRKRATMSMPWLLPSATAPGRGRERDGLGGRSRRRRPRPGATGRRLQGPRPRGGSLLGER